jgi:hypothetical protein
VRNQAERVALQLQTATDSLQAAELARKMQRALDAREAMERDLELIIDMLDLYDISLRVRYIASAQNPSDFFSRYADKGDWMLDRSVAEPLLCCWGACTVDRFADAGNAQLPRFNSGYPSRGAEVVDTFTTSWQRELNWINPPWQLMDKVMYKLDCEPAAAAVLLAPYWPRASWYPTLSRLAADFRVVHQPEGARVRRGPTLPDGAFVPGVILQQVGKVPEPLRNRGWELRAYYIPARSSV